MLLLTLLTYGIYSEIKAESRDPEPDETMMNMILHAVILAFIWPFKVIPLGAKLATQRQQNIWYLIFCGIFLISIIGGLGAYLLVGFFMVAVKAIGYLTIAYRLQRQKEAALALPSDYESWE